MNRLLQEHQTSLAAATAAIGRLEVELEVVQGRLEDALRQREAGDAHLKVEQGRGGPCQRPCREPPSMASCCG